MVAGFGECSVAVGAEQHRVRAVDTDETQLAQTLSNRVRILAHVGGERHDWIAGSLADAFYASGSIALEYGGILREGDLAGGVFCRLPVRIVCAAIDVIDRLAIQFERNSQLDQRLDLALPCDDAFRWSSDGSQMAGANRRETDA